MDDLGIADGSSGTQGAGQKEIPERPTGWQEYVCKEKGVMGNGTLGFSLEKQADVLIDRNCTAWLSYKHCCHNFGTLWMLLFVHRITFLHEPKPRVYFFLFSFSN